MQRSHSHRQTRHYTINATATASSSLFVALSALRVASTAVLFYFIQKACARMCTRPCAIFVQVTFCHNFWHKTNFGKDRTGTVLGVMVSFRLERSGASRKPGEESWTVDEAG